MLNECAQLAFLLVFALYVLNAGYAFNGTFMRLKDLTFVSTTLTGIDVAGTPGNRFETSWIGQLYLPVPKDYVLGIDAQKRDFENFQSASYLRGELRNGGWWYYYLYALCVKTPHGMQCLLLLATGAMFVGKLRGVRRRDCAVLLAPSILVLVLVSSQTEFSQHMRYVLPTFGFVCAFLGGTICFVTSKHQAFRVVVIGSIIYSISSSLVAFPNSLSYFNEFVGGIHNGPKHLLSSNVDWGQDFLFLRDWIRTHPTAKPLYLVCTSSYDPVLIGVRYDSDHYLRTDSSKKVMLRSGWYAFSVNHIYGESSWLFLNSASLRESEPVVYLGGSIRVFHIDNEHTDYQSAHVATVPTRS